MFKIYLSGSIQKGDSDPRPHSYFWTREDEIFLEENIRSDIKLLNPAKTPIRRNNFYLNYGCDLYLVKIADVVLVDLRRSKGIGVGAELMFASMHSIPVIAWLPDDSEYKKDVVRNVSGEDLYDWVHPFAYGLCDKHVSDLDAACREINDMIKNRNISKQSFRTPEHAIGEFQKAYPDLVDDNSKT
ncbi:hypothetical protein ATDW_24140 [Asticcacaulis sp. DW145]|uniref:hypothetical protein n=1 Tax=Asticcacaulis sp. DW145 TaxID=3095608 RepID=UPI00308A6629|nr:hypothetical protein ATDW_24140 [Asticcacaulis sp. DW145]